MGPDDNAGRREDFFDQPEPGQEVRCDPFAGLVAWPKPVTEGLDDVISRNGNVCGTAAIHTQNRPEHAAHRRDLAPVPIPRGRQGAVAWEQLVCAVDEMNVQAATPRQLYRTGGISINRSGCPIGLGSSARLSL